MSNSTALATVSLDQVDDFQDGTTLDWGSGSPGSFAALTPIYVPDGGPNGTGDGYLALERTSVLPFHIAVINDAQWAGNYTLAGINALEMDLNQLAGPDDLSIRILIFGSGGTWASELLQPVAAVWNHFIFGLTVNDLVHVTGSTKVPDGTGILGDTLADVERIQIRHDFTNPTPSGQHPPHIVARLGIDNVRAVPEPASLVLWVILGLFVTRSRL